MTLCTGAFESTVVVISDHQQTESAAALPFVKWAGGKRSLISALTPHIPDEIDTYWEPFVGGGAVFFAFADRIRHAYLSDTNEELVLSYQIVKKRVEDLIDRLRDHERNHNDRRERGGGGKSYYLQVRDLEPIASLDVAARFIYLNKTCFNGLYRVNKAGHFNVPEGDYKNPDICNVDRLRAASKALANATIQIGDFFEVAKPAKGDFVYCDPPYDGCFTDYQPGGFNDDMQTQLRNAANGWRKTGASVVLSNADTELVRRLYRGWSIRETAAPRYINSDGNGRGAVPELIITNG